MSDEIILLGAVAVAGYYAYQSVTQQSGDDSESLGGGGSGYISEVVKKANRMPAFEKKEKPEMQVPQIIIKESSPKIPISRADFSPVSRGKSTHHSGKKYSSSVASLQEIKDYAQKSDKYKIASEGKKYVALKDTTKQDREDYVLVVDNNATVSDVVSAIGDIAKVDDDRKKDNPKKGGDSDKGIIDSIIDTIRGWF